MAKTILIVDKNLIGASKENRARGWSLSTNELRGHPMVSRLSNDRVDYFRRLMARYYSFTVGIRPAGDDYYDNFDYILPSSEFEPDEQASESRNVAFSLAHFGEENYTVPSYEDLPSEDPVHLTIPIDLQDYGFLVAVDELLYFWVINWQIWRYPESSRML